jgi:nicotinate-nucleotide pyrophosphorylase (carboxylating)
MPRAASEFDEPLNSENALLQSALMDATIGFDPPSLFDRLRGAVQEDLSAAGDVTSLALVPEHKTASADFVAKAEGVVCGLNLQALVFQMAEQHVSQEAAARAWNLSDAQEAAAAGKMTWDEVQALRDKTERQAVRVELFKKDGARVAKGDVVATVSGQARALLAGERLGLNLLSHLSGIATYTAACVASIAHTRAKILDTRKTLPLFRDLQKYAVKCGGGENHRKGLYDQVLIKDNHLALWGAGDPAGAVRAARAKFPDLKIEVEVTTLQDLQNVIHLSAPDIILLDNFTAPQLREAVNVCNSFFRANEKKIAKPLLEASGGITKENLIEIAETGIDRISLGALTHSVRALDFSLEFRFSDDKKM